ncbi:3-deoxy-D-manno-octulosonic acid kinase [Dyella marensis]|jgi:3-deoxy-D-manno-octulosonic acid kinase|uniref:3-deoxy-D-manno-octulosonic acid kinase n=1 Tax=Dyella marensis TaxID=500610 RepID=A0A1I1Y1Q6_9GAMM|nr:MULTISPECIES: 3-deoxy-D-manno-octulosonic acid kinase [Dyella]SFE13506.1 3-deoxy-D-manno-octulosonic acid kinase [Dyella marensis]
MMAQEQVRTNAGGAILFDSAASSQVDDDWFMPSHWRELGALRMQTGGRGGVALVGTPAGEGVLRHYRRGGMVARLMGDRYLWTGAERTRSFAEFRLLASMAREGLPVPAPIAARYRRQGPFYTADLITRHVASARTLAECLAWGRLDAELAQRTGELVARFHRAGVWHADLNAHNILVAESQLYLIDFDRGERRPPAEAWRTANLQRLRRSLVKLGAMAESEAVFEKTLWQPLEQGYTATFGVGGDEP